MSDHVRSVVGLMSMPRAETESMYQADENLDSFGLRLEAESVGVGSRLSTWPGESRRICVSWWSLDAFWPVAGVCHPDEFLIDEDGRALCRRSGVDLGEGYSHSLPTRVQSEHAGRSFEHFLFRRRHATHDCSACAPPESAKFESAPFSLVSIADRDKADVFETSGLHH